MSRLHPENTWLPHNGVEAKAKADRLTAVSVKLPSYKV